MLPRLDGGVLGFTAASGVDGLELLGGGGNDLRRESADLDGTLHDPAFIQLPAGSVELARGGVTQHTAGADLDCAKHARWLNGFGNWVAPFLIRGLPNDLQSVVDPGLVGEHNDCEAAGG